MPQMRLQVDNRAFANNPDAIFTLNTDFTKLMKKQKTQLILELSFLKGYCDFFWLHASSMVGSVLLLRLRLNSELTVNMALGVSHQSW